MPKLGSSFFWLVTVRAKENSEQKVSQIIFESILPAIKSDSMVSDVKLAKCVNCRGEYSWAAIWKGDLEGIESFEKGNPYAQALSELADYLRAPQKREVWEILEAQS